MLRQVLALVLCGAVAGTGCASASGPRIAQAPQAAPATQSAQATQPVEATPAAQAENAAIADYVQRLAPGAKVRVERTDGTSFRATLLKATPQAIVVQKNTRVPEPAIEVPLSQVARVTIQTNGSSAGRTIAIGVATGVVATFGMLAILAAIWSD